MRPRSRQRTTHLGIGLCAGLQAIFPSFAVKTSDSVFKKPLLPALSSIRAHSRLKNWSHRVKIRTIAEFTV